MRLSTKFVVTFTMLFVMSMVVSAKTLKESDLFSAQKSHMPEPVLLQIIGTYTDTDIDLSATGRANLLTAGFSVEVLNALDRLGSKPVAGQIKKIAIVADSQPAVGSAPAVQTVQSGDCPEQFGVYYMTLSGNWIPVERHAPRPNVTGGVFKSALTSGLSKTSQKWEFAGSEASFKVSGSNPEFCVRGRDISQTSITLAILKSHGDMREVEFSNQNLLGKSEGRRSENFRPVDMARMADGAISVRLSGLEPGHQYALDINGIRPEYDFGVSTSSTLASRE